MDMHRPRPATRFVPLAALFVCCLLPRVGLAQSEWTIVAPPAMQADEAISVALGDLKETAGGMGIPIAVVDGSAPVSGRVIFLGDAAGNRVTSSVAADGAAVELAPPENPEGYRIEPLVQAGSPCLAVTSNGAIGTAYGLYWIRDRMLVHQEIPVDLRAFRKPAFPVRLGGAWGRWGFGGRNREDMRIALRNSINWVPGTPVLDLVPWDAEPEAANNTRNREETRALIAYAHSLHMKYFSFANEFTYHPSLLEKHGATLSPDDPRLWEALQDKFRMLFTALPELDGVELCNDDISGFWENYVAYDLLHANPESDWSYPKRFRTFVKKVHEVVADEFDKEYFHFSWSLSDHEQHTQPAVFREIFTDEIPTNNFYVMPKVTRADRWWHQPYNPTFNLSPHDTIVLFETMNYYEGGGTHLFPTFSGDYFQRGLQTFLMPEHTNVRGMAMLASIPGDGWGTRDAYAYVLYRLMWDPYDDMAQIARDFCSIHFGRDVAEGMAEIYRLSPHAYKYGLHIEPISYGQFNSFQHMRVGVFPVEGYPNIDGGREHLEWLRKIYLRCKPWEEETLEDIRHGHEVAESMYGRFQEIKGQFSSADVASTLGNQLDMTRRLIETNQRYVESILAYFDYLDQPSDGGKKQLDQVLSDTRATCGHFAQLPGYGYKLWGIEALMNAMEAASADVEAHRQALAAAPSRDELETAIGEQQRRYAAVLESHKGEAVKFAHVRVLVDGRDIINVQGDQYTLEHIRWDNPHVQEFAFTTPLPAKEVTVVPMDIESRPLHPFMLAQPNAENGYTARLYLDDLPGGGGWMEFELYYIDERPEVLGLAAPWED